MNKRQRFMARIPFVWRVRMCRFTIGVVLVITIMPVALYGACCGFAMASHAWASRFTHAMRHLVESQEVTP